MPIEVVTWEEERERRRALPLGPAEKEALARLAATAGSPDRIVHPSKNGALSGPETGFALGNYRFTFSWVEFPGGKVCRTLAVALADGGLPEPWVVNLLAYHLGFTGGRLAEDDVVSPGKDWATAVVRGSPGYLLVLQPVKVEPLN